MEVKKDIKTAYSISGNIADFNPAIDDPFEHVVDNFGYDVTSNHVPLGMAILKMATLLEAIDWHLYATGILSEKEAREKIKWAADLMDKKFDITYERLPQ